MSQLRLSLARSQSGFGGTLAAPDAVIDTHAIAHSGLASAIIVCLVRMEDFRGARRGNAKDGRRARIVALSGAARRSMCRCL